MQLLGQVFLAIITTSAILQQALCMIDGEEIVEVGKPSRIAMDRAAQVSEAGAPLIRYPERTSPSEACYIPGDSASHTAAKQDSPPGAHHTSAHPTLGTSSAEGATIETPAPRDDPTRAAIITDSEWYLMVQTLGTVFFAGLIAVQIAHSPEGLKATENPFCEKILTLITCFMILAIVRVIYPFQWLLDQW